MPGTGLITNPGSVYPNIRRHPSLFEIVPGTAAGFALGAVYDSLEMRDGTPCVRRRLPLTIVTDHKVADYADVARFIARVEELCADGETLARFW